MDEGWTYSVEAKGKPGSLQKPIQNSFIWRLEMYFLSLLFGTFGINAYADVHIPAMNPSPRTTIFFISYSLT